MSSHNPNEKLEPQKSKVSVALAINHGLGGPKAMVKTAADGQLVNIPAQPCALRWGTKEIRWCALLVWHPWRNALRKERTRVAGTSGIYLADITEAPFKKSPLYYTWFPYRKPTQVGEARSLRGTSDLPLRN